MSRTPRLVALAGILLGIAGLKADPIELPVWPGTAPGSEKVASAEKWEERGKDGATDRAVRNVNRPTLTVYLPDSAKNLRVAILIAPGGAYEHLAIDKEGFEIGKFLADHGIAGAVLKYRLPKTAGSGYTVQTALADAVQGLKDIRSHASEWGVDPKKVGMIGFSAGGNLTALTSTRPPIEERPNFSGLIYPAVPASFGNVPDDVPPAFLAQADDDPLGTENCIRYYTWLREKKVPAEIHLYSRGGHGFGLGKAGTSTTGWPQAFVNWIQAVILAPPTK